ncbi:uncharacterized protein LOC120086186 [Benincasa hispida]|uniref:uncharacterized protein LOC120086186 n=1 Tax=Benincasa hispida TaxID=102211 RepID=UPI0019025F8C|nr:uncharacterized protein LOC120086186 [Benincasa hispida]XP_038898640.1 uncharacterized protein LOC120086186 [Benincasa hispida]XP_038898641.1 uncharacterized protein LOC120086186 [Benincasa hispida]XP_038898642.1 uncharacterized protein LOC120086186 [Benincasa hispida]
MGASTSTEKKVPDDQKEAEALAASTGALPQLQSAFSKLANPQTNAIPFESLQKCFFLGYENRTQETSAVPESFQAILDHVGLTIAELFFIPEEGGVTWVEFLKGYNKCCGKISASVLLNTLIRVFDATMVKVGFPPKLEFTSYEDEFKMSGFLLPGDVLMLFLTCWAMFWDSSTFKALGSNSNLFLPDINNLVLSSVISCAEVGNTVNIWDCDILGLAIEVPIEKFLSWAVKTVPSLPDGLSGFVHARILQAPSREDGVKSSSSSAVDIDSPETSNSFVLSRGTAWAVSLTQRGGIREEITKICFLISGDGNYENLLYRSSLHGRGLNRFWSNVEGYQGPLFVVVHAVSGDTRDGCTNELKWTVGVLTFQGFENRDLFYGSRGNIYALSPVFDVYSPTGKEKNFVYSHLHPSARVYEPHPKPVGIAFGGSMGNERIFIDEDFARVTVRHHVVDKTYQPGPLFPGQGFLPVEASILEVEVWGFGGSRAKEIQNSYKKREELFTEQRRKVDLKTFASWEDSPEKMMLDMMSDPNAVRREDR